MEIKFLGSTGLARFLEKLREAFSAVGHTHSKSEITDFPTIPTKVSQLTNDSGYKTTDNNTTYTLTKNGQSIVLSGSDGTTTSVEDEDTIIAVDSSLSSSSTNPVQNKVINSALAKKVPVSRTINGKPLSGDITLSYNDVNADISGAASSALSESKAYTDEEVGLVAEDLESHLNDGNNPHGVIASQVGAVPISRTVNGKELSTNISLSASDVGADTSGSADLALSSAKSYTDGLVSDVSDSLTAHVNNTNNPHKVTKAAVGLSNVENTSDANKPVSTAQKTAIADAKKAGTDAQATIGEHVARTDNPHKVTAAQAGAVPTSRTVNGKALSNNISLTASDVGADSTGTATSTVSSHNTSKSSHADIRALIDEVTTKLNSFLDVDEETADQLSELIQLINDNKDNIASITTDKVNYTDIVDNLTTNLEDKALSAAQGVALKKLIDGLQTAVNQRALDSDLDSHTGDTTVHITAEERTNWNAACNARHDHSNKTVIDGITSAMVNNWNAAKEKLDDIENGAQVNQNAFGTIAVGDTQIKADTEADTLTLAGSGITISADASEDKVTFSHPTQTSYTGKPTANATPGFGSTFTVSQVETNGYGHVTKMTDRTVKIPNTAATTSAAGLMSSDDKTKLDKTNVAYGTCSTAAATAAKVITVSGNTEWSLSAGSMISIFFTYTNSASNPTFNVNGTGAKNIFYGASRITTGSLGYAGTANRICNYVYDGTQFRFHSWGYDENTNTQVRVYRQDSTSYNADYPLIASRTKAASLGTVGDESSYESVYGLISDTNANIPTTNPYTGETKMKALTVANTVKATTFDGDLSGNADTATTASKIGTSTVGSTTKPVYIKDGVPTETTYSLGKSVPSDALFTDTVYTHPTYTARTGVPAADATLKHGGTFTVSQPVSNATGHITAVNSRTYTLPSETTLSKGTDGTASKTLSFGGTFTAVTDTAVSGHKITDTTTTYTLPSDRLFTTLVPTGTAISTTGTDLNTITYLKVGRYYCSANATAKTLVNCPTDKAFMMEVYSLLSATIDDEKTNKYCYRIRKITVYNTGVQYVQQCQTSGTAGVWTYNPWYVVPRTPFTLDTTDNNGGSAALGSKTRSVYLDSTGTFVEGNIYAGGTAVTLNGTSKAASTASLYAPTSAGTSGQILKSSGSGEPTWLTTLPIANGGTGSTTAAGALTNFGITATAAELNKLDGVTATTAEINKLDGLSGTIMTSSNVIAINDAAVTFSSGVAKYTNANIKSTSIVIVQRRAGTTDQHTSFSTHRYNGYVKVYTASSFSSTVNLNIIIINP